MTSGGLLSRVPLAGGAVMAQLYAHEVPAQAGAPVPCWSYVSEGLRAHNQPEVVLTVRRQPGESEPPEGGLRLLKRVAAMVLRGQHVENGGIVELGPDGPFGDPASDIRLHFPAITEEARGSVPGLTPASRADAQRRPAEPRFDCLCPPLAQANAAYFRTHGAAPRRANR